MGVTDSLAKYVVDERIDNFPKEVVQRAKQMILDNIGCAFGGYVMDGGRILVNVVKQMGGNQDATIIGDGTKVSCMLGAGVNAQLANILDFDETGTRGHPGSSTCQAAIAVGEKLGASGKRVIEAFVTGYEVVSRIEESGDTSKLKERGVRINAGRLFGPAVAAARLLDLDHQQVKHTIAIAGSIAPIGNAGRLIDRPSHMIKNGNLWHCWLAIGAAFLAQGGFTGPYDYLDGRRGFWSPFTETVDFGRMTEKLGEYYYTSGQLQLKPWSTCRHTHPGIELVLDVLKEQKIGHDDIEKIKYKSHQFVCSPPYNEPKPKEMWDAFWSVPFAMALAILGVEPGPDWYAKERFDDSTVLNLAEKISVEPLPEATEAYVKRGIERLVGEIEVMARGEVYTKRTEGVKGDPQRPMSQEELNEKFTSLATRVISDKQIKDIINQVNNLEAVEDISTITALFKHQGFHQ